MRFMVMVRGNASTESGALPSTEELEAMGAFNEELVRTGVMLAGDGLHPSAKGARVTWSDAGQSVVDGPFTESKELIAGFWLWQCASLEEAVEWAKRCPKPTHGESALEIRQVFEAEDFGDAMTPELAESEERMRDEVAGRG